MNIRAAVYLSLQIGGNQAKVLGVLDKPRNRCKSQKYITMSNICLRDRLTGTNCDILCQQNKTHFSLKISFSCSVQTFMNCRALYTFIGSSMRPFMLINFTRLCSESYIMGGMTDSCLICFSLFCKTWIGSVATVS